MQYNLLSFSLVDINLAQLEQSSCEIDTVINKSGLTTYSYSFYQADLIEPAWMQVKHQDVCSQVFMAQCFYGGNAFVFLWIWWLPHTAHKELCRKYRCPNMLYWVTKDFLFLTVFWLIFHSVLTSTRACWYRATSLRAPVPCKWHQLLHFSLCP